MSYELPYNDCYAVISLGNSYGANIIEVTIRNADHKSSFRTNYELVCRWYISSEFDKPYGGELSASAHSMTLSDLKSAAKSMTAIFNKLDSISTKYGYASSWIDNVVRVLTAAKVKEVRLWEDDVKNWSDVEPLSIKTHVNVIKYKLSKYEVKSRERYPYKEKSNE